MRTTVNLDEELLTKAKIAAAREHRTLSEIIEDALRQAFARSAHCSEQPPIELPVFHGNGLLPGVDLDDSDALLELMDEGDGVA